MVAFAEEIEVQVGQHGREAVGVLELDLLLTVAGAQPILLRADGPGEQTGRIEPIELALAAVRRQRHHLARLGEEHAHHGLVVLAMRPEIMERIGMARRDHVAGLG